MSDLNYPDNLYADHLAKQEPTGAYRAPSEIDEVEALLKTAHAHMRHAAECIDKALAAHIRSRSKRLIALMTAEAQARGEYDDQPAKQTAKQAYDEQTRRDVFWSVQRGDFSLPKWHVDFGKPKRDDLPPILTGAVKTPLEPTRIATPAELADLRQLLTAEELKGFGIGDVEPVLPYPRGWFDGSNPHPMAAEALRQADEFNLGSGETGV